MIDNGSTDESLEFIQDYYPEIKIIVLEDNLGFAKGYNDGLQHIANPYLILLNSDVRVTKGWANALISRLQSSSRIAAVQPKIRSDENPSMYEYAGAAGGQMDILNYPYCYGRTPAGVDTDSGQYETAKEIFWASGAAMAIRNDTFKKIGGFESILFAHQEEIDLCWRLKRAGYQIWYEPTSLVYHLGGGTLDYDSPSKTFLNFRNNQIIILKNESFINLIWKLPIRLILDIIASLRFALQKNGASAKAILRAWGYIFTHLPMILKLRRRAKNLTADNRIGDKNMRGKTNRLTILEYLK